MSNNQLSTVFEDDYLIAINKPSGWLSIPGRNAENIPCVLTKLQASYTDLMPVHRIDKETTGTLILAKSPEVHKSMNQLFADRSILKEYHALAHGDLAEFVDIDNYLSPAGNGKMKVSRKGKRAQSEFTPEERFGSWTWCRVKINTGRTHQIRVHAAHLGHPLVGDVLYGGRPLAINDIKPSARSNEMQRPLINRTALHALSLSFTHPVTSEKIRIESALPKDLKAGLNQLRKWKRPIAN